MRAYKLPADTTIDLLLLKVLPDEHAARVPGHAGTPYRAVLRLKGAGGGWYSFQVRGASMTVSPGESADRDLWMVTDVSSLQRLLDDALGPHEILPHEVPWHPVVELVTDPRIVSRLRLMDGSVRLELTQVPRAPGPLWAVLGAGPRVLKHVDEHEPDTTIQISYELYRELALGQTDIETAKGQGRFRVSGSVMLAMQLGMALAPLMPVRS